MLATRPEMQVAGDWMLVPSDRNLHWRDEVLHRAFMVCKQQLSLDANRQQNLDQLVAATKHIWERFFQQHSDIERDEETHKRQNRTALSR